MSRIYIVVPCYNEQAVLKKTADALKSKLCSLIEKNAVSQDSKILFVDDGSEDSTWQIMTKLCDEAEIFEAIRLSANKGHQTALYAGLMTARERCDAAISIDADLQDDIDVIDSFIERFDNGCDIVFGVRSNRRSDSVLKRSTANAFYKASKLMGSDVINNHADYRLMSKRTLDVLSEYKEVNLFLRAIVKQMGFKTDCVYYDRAQRLDGTSKYTLSKMLRLAGDGIISFSERPINFILLASVLSSMLGAALLITALVLAIGSYAPSLYLILGSIWLSLGILLLCLWIVGKYVGKMFFEVKARPRYVISDKILKNDKNN